MTDTSPDGPTARRHRRAPRLSPRWLAATGVAVLAAVVGVALAVQSGAPACAAGLAAPPDGSTRQGKATFYDSGGAGGNCSYPSAPADRMYVALGPSEYADAAACGGYLDVTGPKGKVRVLVMDRCPECPAGHIDLSKEAFAKIADPVQGIVPVSYRAVANPSGVGPLTFRMKDGTSQFWFAVLVGEHGNALRSVEARSGGSAWRPADRQDYNYWVIDGGLGAGPYSIRVTDVRGQRAVAQGIKLLPEQTQRSTVRMYGGGSAPGRAAASPTRRSPGPPTPTPAGSPSGTPTAAAGVPVAPGTTAAPAAASVPASCDG
ncbi:expansin EXLX1 family cellulose-binding protein [Solwaraspora sp. WMMD1047]|uniref:expansin EXLX1 family cellulose-binding protein n=1 Tax=Solwaraspora sp. WMMD1047 TaxID=3016102 RepID=UPI002417E8FE|nr:expansin EXLX1 family cellulose-binding protein [Solwaraspora sp. WMMD1047]MDG4829213.1 expansin EXLX1 family cellulose-binding protein [Solwaraspora sp. WMMD1047]